MLRNGQGVPLGPRRQIGVWPLSLPWSIDLSTKTTARREHTAHALPTPTVGPRRIGATGSPKPSQRHPAAAAMPPDRPRSTGIPAFDARPRQAVACRRPPLRPAAALTPTPGGEQCMKTKETTLPRPMRRAAATPAALALGVIALSTGCSPSDPLPAGAAPLDYRQDRYWAALGLPQRRPLRQDLAGRARTADQRRGRRLVPAPDHAGPEQRRCGQRRRRRRRPARPHRRHARDPDGRVHRIDADFRALASPDQPRNLRGRSDRSGGRSRDAVRVRRRRSRLRRIRRAPQRRPSLRAGRPQPGLDVAGAAAERAHRRPGPASASGRGLRGRRVLRFRHFRHAARLRRPRRHRLRAQLGDAEHDRLAADGLRSRHALEVLPRRAGAPGVSGPAPRDAGGGRPAPSGRTRLRSPLRDGHLGLRRPRGGATTQHRSKSRLPAELATDADREDARTILVRHNYKRASLPREHALDVAGEAELGAQHLPPLQLD